MITGATQHIVSNIFDESEKKSLFCWFRGSIQNSFEKEHVRVGMPGNIKSFDSVFFRN